MQHNMPDIDIQCKDKVSDELALASLEEDKIVRAECQILMMH